MIRSLSIRILLGTGLVVSVSLGCGREDDDAAAAKADSGRGKQITATAGTDQASGAVPGRTAAVPADPCTWLPVAEVEAVMGKLTGPPTRIGNGCHFPVAADSALLAKKTQLRELVKQIPGANDSAAIRDTSWDKAAVIVLVDVDVGTVGGRVDKYSQQMLAAMLARQSANGDSGQGRPSKPEGWDAAQGSFSTFEGRIGHVRVTVRERTLMSRPLVPFEKKVALAARVRDRIPDLPFANPNASVAATASPGPDPCSVITRVEAEAVLGPLVVEPYRVGETEPFADVSGRSCGYFTKSHHVLVVTPHWSDGKQALKMMRGLERLVSIAAPDASAEAADTLEGPWDEAAVDMDGSLAFLKGDRLLRISYGTSSIDEARAVQLARSAVDRLASSR